MKKLSIISLAVLAFSLQSCRKDYNYVEPTPPPITTPVLFSSGVYPLIVTYCQAGCHTGGAPSGLNFTDATTSYNTLTANTTMVNINAPEQSQFYVCLSDPGVPSGSGQMPQGGPYMSSTEKQTILAWITQGALNN